MKSVVMKFGGSSVADAACMRQVMSVVKRMLPEAPLIVLSAMGKTTNALFAAARSAEQGLLDKALAEVQVIRDLHLKTAKELLCSGTEMIDAEQALGDRFSELEHLIRGVALLRELTPRSMDAIASFGERTSTILFAALLRSEGIETALIDARTILRTDDHFGAAEPQIESIRDLAKALLASILQPGKAAVTQGYIGSTAEGLTTTLGRGGSDYSASLFGAAIGACEVQIWTDVEGVLTCDPRIVAKATAIKELSFAEASELAAFGASVLHPATIQPAVDAGIPVTVRHTQRPDGHFTSIRSEVSTGRSVTALASRGKTTVLTVTSTRMLQQSGFLARLFDAFARHRISVDLIATAEVSVSLTVDTGTSLKSLIAELSGFAKVQVAEGRAIVAIVGERLKQTPGLAACILTALGTINVEMISMGASELNLSLVVREDEAPEALRRLHAALFEGK